MTRIIYLPDEVTIIQFEVKIPPRQLSASINAGLRPIPQLARKTEKLTASQVGNTILVYPDNRAAFARDKKTESLLTRRQCEVLSLATSGYSNSQIAEIMGISIRTVSYHLRGIRSRIRPGDLSSLLAKVEK